MTRAPGAELDSGACVPGWAVYAGLIIAAVGTFLAAAAGTALPVGFLVVVCLAIAASAVSAVRQHGYITLAVALVPTTIALLTLAPVGYTWRTPVLMVAIHATLRLSWYVSVITLVTRVEVAVLAAEGRRFTVVNLVGQAVALLAGALTIATGDGSGASWIGVAAAAALLVLALALRTGARAWPRTGEGSH